MFERLTARVEARARQRAGAAAAELRERIVAEAAPGVRAELADGGVLLTGRRLARRWVVDPALRWLIAGASR